MTSPKSQRAHALFFGTVQGVGFRFTVLEISKGWKISGFVRNMDDGSVEVVAEGPEGELKGFFDAISGSRLGGLVSETNLSWSPAQGVFRGFKIEY